mmetsp:Transcript_38948/g.62744  ORF Transcript_38948/g.62744 Transcript_38948/m.62744 type:complete len:401 (+) Transcript_38948:682-1884(+)|eukprot:CAMPEP_0203769492 /NCGR_PEP_ID=MMETSP0099_2-20121227/2218_1 /ASSEMBLY_ACC=CAM_ASM_000209 /TAXON_ID=96639 /ORGANISM=" , Strain NY0313808BC1" /LENGTH=400 /DNA_ID=CAMNT_0050666389 /DNA_START=277 /DNA_END=1479 /DNA_ORIENTATION=-
MIENGLGKSVFPMSDLSVMGLSEIVTSLPLLRRRLFELSDAVLAEKPDVLLTIDGKGFNFRLLKMLTERLAGRTTPYKFHVVSPSPWAFKDKRSLFLNGYDEHSAGCLDYSEIIDEMFSILPFEPQYFKSKCTFVGHPVVEEYYELTGSDMITDIGKEVHCLVNPQHDPPGHRVLSPSDFIKNHPLPEWARFSQIREQPLECDRVGIFPGSRAAEVEHTLSVLQQMVETIQMSLNCNVDISTLPTTRDRITEFVNSVEWKYEPPSIVAPKADMISNCSAAVAMSGTIVTELAMYGIPTVAMYDAHWLTAYIARRLAKVDFVSLPNIMAGEELIPEHVFRPKFNGKEIAKSLINLVEESQRSNQRLREDILPHLVQWDSKFRLPIAPSKLIVDAIFRKMDS